MSINTIAKGKTNSGLAKYAAEQIGLPYWYGTFGQIATESLYISKKKKYPDYYKPWTDFPKQYGLRVHDCVGLIKGYIWSDSPTSTPKYSILQDKSACGMYSVSTIKGTISSFPAHIGQLVYKSTVKNNAKKIHHVGIYVGDGFVIEAKGHEYGVVRTKFEGAGWTHWSQCPYIEDDSQGAPRSFSGDFSGQFQTTGRVYIRAGAGTKFKSLGVIKKGETVSCEGYFSRVGQTEWLMVRANLGGKPTDGWMSGKYLRKI